MLGQWLSSFQATRPAKAPQIFTWNQVKSTKQSNYNSPCVMPQFMNKMYTSPKNEPAPIKHNEMNVSCRINA